MPLEPWLSQHLKVMKIKRAIGRIANPVKRNAMFADKRNWGK